MPSEGLMTTLTPIQDGTWVLPCINCGRLLDYEIIDDFIVCECGVKYAQEILAGFRAPGSWRHWIATFACACPGKVTTEGDSVEVVEHRCYQGKVTATAN